MMSRFTFLKLKEMLVAIAHISTIRQAHDLKQMNPMLHHPMSITTPHSSKQSGFSYVEVLLSVMLISILIVPAMQSLNTAIRGNSNCIAERQLLLRNKMEEMLSKPFGGLYAAASTTNITTINNTFSDSGTDACGVSYRRAVVMFRTDAAAITFTSSDTGLVYVKVYFESEGSTNALNTLVGRWW